MKKVKLINLKGEVVKELKVNEIFDITPNDKVLYDAIILVNICHNLPKHEVYGFVTPFQYIN